MKKYYFYCCLAAAAMLAACQNKSARSDSEQTADSLEIAQTDCSVEIPDLAYETDEVYVLHGQIKQLKASYFHLESEKEEAGKELIHTEDYTFDRSGNMLTHLSYAADGTLSGRTEYSYKNGFKQSEKYFSDGAETPSITNEYVYDERGNLTEETARYSYSKSPQKSVYTYDAEGHVLSWTSYWENGNLRNKTEYTYDDEGRKLTATEFFSSGEVMQVVDYSYDAEGQLIREGAQGRESDYTTYSYTNGGLLAGMNVYYDGKLSMKMDYSYDELGNCKSAVCTAEGEIASKAEYSYDEQGILTRRLLLSRMEADDWNLLEIEYTLW